MTKAEKEESEFVRTHPIKYQLTNFKEEGNFICYDENEMKRKLEDFCILEGGRMTSGVTYYYREYRAEKFGGNHLFQKGIWSYSRSTMLDEYYVSKDYVSKLTQVDARFKKILDSFNKNYIRLSNGAVFTNAEGLAFIEEIKKPHNILHLKDDPSQVWFKIDGELVKSSTKSYYNYLIETYDLVIPEFFEEEA